VKRGKAVYTSGKVVACVAEDSAGVTQVCIEYPEQSHTAAVWVPLGEFGDLREIVRQVETYELTGPTRRETLGR